MLHGDLATTPIETILVDLADERATGCLHIVNEDGDEALVYLRAGLIYAISVPGDRPQLGARLISSNALVPEGLAEALEAQRTELQGWRLGELLIHLGFVEQRVVEAFVQEQVTDGFADLVSWTAGRWRFRDNEKTREDVAPPTTVAELIEAVRGRQAEWAQIVGSVHGPNAVPTLSARGGEADVMLDPDAWSLLCKIDGERSIGELAHDCGFTLFEAGNVVRSLVEAGLIDVEEDLGPDDDQRTSLPDDGAISMQSDVEFPDFPTTFDADVAPVDDSPVADDTPALLRLSQALTQSFVPGPVGFVDPFHVPDELRLRPAARAEPMIEEPSEEDVRRERLRQAAAAELAAAHAEAEAMRKQIPLRVAEVVDLDARREAVRVDAERREAEKLEAERLEIERLEAAAAEAAEAERLEAERLAAEAAAREQAEREAAEAERLEAERLETERLAAEAAAREQAEREAAEAAEAERLEAERVAAREQAEREAAEAERLEAERLAAEAAAKEQAEREAAEAERLAEAAEAERLAEAAEAERLAEAAEAERLAEAAEAERLAEAAAREQAEREAAEAAERAAAAAARAAAERALAEAAEHAAAETPDDPQDGTDDSTVPAEPDIVRYADADAATRLASATALLSELSRTGATTLEPERAEDAGSPQRDAPPSEDEADDSADLPEPIVQRDMTDTASLLRELSSLGFEDDSTNRPPHAWSAPSSRRPPTAAPPKKKRGLFGR